METTKTLIHQDDQQVSGITEEVMIRLRLLNSMIDAGISPNEIPKVVSQQYIEDVLFQKHLQLNKLMAREFAAGKKQRYLVESYTLPAELEHLKSVMEQFLNYPLPHRGFNKFTNLRFVDTRYELDHDSLEMEFVTKKLKLYVNGDVQPEIGILDLIIDYAINKNMALNQLSEISFLNERFTRDTSLACNRLPEKKVMIKRSYLMREH